MATIQFKGSAVETNGNFPTVGQQAPDFKLVSTDLSEVSLADYKGKRIVFNIFPSVDTGTCAMQLRTFSQKMSGASDTVLFFTSMDLPFAFARFCGAEGVTNAVTASDFRHNSMVDYGVKMVDGPLEGLYARAVLVLNEDHQVIHSELCSEITNEPDYDAALAALS